MSEVRFATMADADHAGGVVALVNSLRVHGHPERVTVLDLGLSSAQRAALAPECDMVSAPDVPTHPWLLVPAAILAACRAICADGEAPVVVYLDCDQIVAAPLDHVIADALAGKVCGFVDRESTRWFAEWADCFALAAPLRRQPYVNAGFVALATGPHEEFLRRWADRCAALDGMTIELVDIHFDDPCALPDQDALNALMMSEVSADAVALYPAAHISQGIAELAATRVVDAGRLVCERAGTRVEMLHSLGVPKPWRPDARRDLHRSAYLTLLRRLVTDPGSALRAGMDMPAWLRPGWRGALVLHRLTVSEALRRNTRVVRRRLGLVTRSSDARRPSRAGGS